MHPFANLPGSVLLLLLGLGALSDRSPTHSLRGKRERLTLKPKISSSCL